VSKSKHCRCGIEMPATEERYCQDCRKELIREARYLREARRKRAETAYMRRLGGAGCADVGLDELPELL
jgi:hypothetical protein